MQPSCIKHHINICPNAFVEFIKIDTQMFLTTPRLPLLGMVIKNRFAHHMIGNKKKNWCCNQIFNFLGTELGKQFFSIANL
jgi:hypothetical protein